MAYLDKEGNEIHGPTDSLKHQCCCCGGDEGGAPATTINDNNAPAPTRQAMLRGNDPVVDTADAEENTQTKSSLLRKTLGCLMFKVPMSSAETPTESNLPSIGTM